MLFDSNPFTPSVENLQWVASLGIVEGVVVVLVEPEELEALPLSVDESELLMKFTPPELLPDRDEEEVLLKAR